jgi:hypothetical protein
MRLVRILGTVTLFVVGASSLARAANVDCEPARCAVQSALDTQCPCAAATNHGRHVSCVAHVLKQMVADGTVPKECRGRITRCAARSICGKEGFVTCQIPVTGTCDLATGFCVEDPTLACLSDTDCVIGSKCKTKRSSDLCLQSGGSVGAGTTCCADCIVPVP